jgi:hypothetical protein
MLDFSKLIKKDWDVAMLTNIKMGNIPLESQGLEIFENGDMIVIENYKGTFPFQEGRETKEGYNEDFKKGKKNCVETFHMNKEDVTGIVYYKKNVITTVKSPFEA